MKLKKKRGRKPLPPLEKGTRYGRLVLVGPAPTNLNRLVSKHWIVTCDCGETFCTWGSSLVNGNTKSCGCLRRETSRKNAVTNKRPTKLTADALFLLGKRPDPQIAKMCGVTREAVRRWRLARKIPSYRQQQQKLKKNILTERQGFAKNTLVTYTGVDQNMEQIATNDSAATLNPSVQGILVAGPFTLDGMTVTVEDLNWEAAGRYLKHADAEKNRNLRRNRVYLYARAMIRGEWTYTHQGLAFAEDGLLRDGQHRLTALASLFAEEKPVTVRVLIFRSFADSAMPGVDNHLTRSGLDILSLAGKQVNTRVVAAIRGMWSCSRPYKSTGSATMLNTDLIKLYDTIGEAASEVVAACPSTTKAVVLSVLARARLNGAPLPLISRFAWVIHQGYPKEALPEGFDQYYEDWGAQVLARWLAREGTQGGGNKARQELAEKTEYALQHFLQNERKQRLFKAAQNPFPLPDYVKLDERPE